MANREKADLLFLQHAVKHRAKKSDTDLKETIKNVPKLIVQNCSINRGLSIKNSNENE